MRNCLSGLALLLALGLGTLIAIPTGAAEPVDAKKIEQLIAKLGSDDFADREKATAELDKLGDGAVEALKKAAQSKDVEVSRRATDLVAKIEKRGEAARLLAPKKVHLVYRDTPVAEAIADFNKKSGYTITVVDPQAKLKDRKVSLDTGEVTFWQAYDLFCEQAGLVEMDPLQGFGGANPFGGVAVPINVRPVPIRAVPPRAVPGAPVPPPEKNEKPQQGALNREGAPQVAVAFAETPAQPPVPPAPNPAPAVARIQIIGGAGGAGGIVVGPGGFGAIGFNGGVGPQQLVLVDGKAKTMPADNTGAIRVKALEKVDLFGRPNDKETLVGIRLQAEPKLTVLQVLNVRVDKAVDDKDQKLTQAANPPANANVPGAFPRAAGPAAIGFAPAFLGVGNASTPIRLNKGEKASKSLKELTGVVSAQILTPATPIITADKIMDAVGKEFKGGDGGKIKILSVTKAANGQITVKFELEQPANIVAANPLAVPGIQIMPAPIAVPLPAPVPPAKPVPGTGRGQGFKAEPPPPPAAPAAQVQIQIQARPGVVVAGPLGGPAMFPMQANGITMQDEKGNVIPVVGVNNIFRRDAKGFVRENVLVFQPAKDQVPAKLVFSGSKSVAIDIPFTLKNVMIP